MQKKPQVYLAGRMNRKDPYDSQWRTDLTPFLENLGFEVLDPYHFEPMQLKGLHRHRLPDGISHWHELRHSKDPSHQNRFLKYMRRIIKYDLNLVKNIADFIIVYWDEGCRDGAGTQSEITVAWDIGKLVYCVAAAKLPAWARGCCEEVFTSFDELKAFLKEEFGDDDDEVDKEKVPTDS